MRDWEGVRIALRWVEGQLEARLGDFIQAKKRLDRVRRYLLESGPLRQAVAATLDLALIHCRHQYGDNYRTVKSMLRSCLSRFPEQPMAEEAMLRDGLAVLRRVLEEDPEDHAFDAIVALRSSFVVAVPGIVGERLGGGGIVLVG